MFSCFNKYYNLLYNNKKKVISQNIESLLTARGLVYWIKDDRGKLSN